MCALDCFTLQACAVFGVYVQSCMANRIQKANLVYLRFWWHIAAVMAGFKKAFLFISHLCGSCTGSEQWGEGGSGGGVGRGCES